MYIVKNFMPTSALTDELFPVLFSCHPSGFYLANLVDTFFATV